MGAATVMMAAGEILPPNVVCVMADCGYSSPKDIIIKVATEDMHLPGKLCFPLIWLGARIFGKFNLTSDSPVKAVKKNKLPLLIVHGMADSFVPYHMSEKIYEAATTKDKKLLLFKGAAHGISYMNNRDRYIAEMEAFLSKTTGYTPES
jgi:alpha-beta hydrolase superfamily lysophospholipase